MKIIYRAILKQAKRFITSSIRCTWLILSMLCCEPVIIPEDICFTVLTRIIIAMMWIGWWISAYDFCGHPMLSSLFFLLGGAISLVNTLSLTPTLRASIAPFFSGLAYLNLVMIDMTHLHSALSIYVDLDHLISHLILFAVAIYSFMSQEPLFRSSHCNHQRICQAEALAHSIMAIIEPVYLILVIQNTLEYYEQLKS